MAVFCPYVLPGPDRGGPPEVRAIAWSKDNADNPLLAVATDRDVRIFNDEGEQVHRKAFWVESRSS